MQFTINVSHDEGEAIWFVQSSDVPGLNAEAATFEQLVEIITDVAPDLIAANIPEADTGGDSLAFCVQTVVNARRDYAA